METDAHAANVPMNSFITWIGEEAVAMPEA